MFLKVGVSKIINVNRYEPAIDIFRYLLLKNPVLNRDLVSDLPENARRSSPLIKVIKAKVLANSELIL
jgi:hypothetical protein